MVAQWEWKESKSTEYMDWKDTGCEISKSCLQCPLPVCKHDSPIWFSKYKNIAKYRVLFHLLSLPHTTEDIFNMATHYNLASRTVFRLKTKLLTNQYEQKYIDLFANLLDAD